VNAADNLVARLTAVMGNAAPAMIAFLEAQFADPVERLAQLQAAVSEAEALTPKRR
jgi:hypothetical protein